MDLGFSSELIWFCMDNFENPLSRQVLRNHCIFVMRSRLMSFIEKLTVCCYHVAKSFGNSNSVRPIVKMSSACRSRNFLRLHTSQF